MTPPDTRQAAAYEITPRVWRDEQPGDDPRLVVSITFVPRTASDAWQDVRVGAMEVRADDRRWTPTRASLAPFGDAGFEVTAFGDATIPAGAKATLSLTLHTSSGKKHVEVAVEITRVG